MQGRYNLISVSVLDQQQSKSLTTYSVGKPGEEQVFLHTDNGIAKWQIPSGGKIQQYLTNLYVHLPFDTVILLET